MIKKQHQLKIDKNEKGENDQRRKRGWNLNRTFYWRILKVKVVDGSQSINNNLKRTKIWKPKLLEKRDTTIGSLFYYIWLFKGVSYYTLQSPKEQAKGETRCLRVWLLWQGIHQLYSDWNKKSGVVHIFMPVLCGLKLSTYKRESVQTLIYSGLSFPASCNPRTHWQLRSALAWN